MSIYGVSSALKYILYKLLFPQLNSKNYCAEITEFFRFLHLPIAGEDIGCDGREPRVHLYNCIQHGKKMHPDFDR